MGIIELLNAETSGQGFVLFDSKEPIRLSGNPYRNIDKTNITSYHVCHVVTSLRCCAQTEEIGKLNLESGQSRI